MRGRRSAPKKATPRADVQALASLKRMLSMAQDLDKFTVDQLTRMYAVDRRTAEYELTIARQRRSAPLT